MEDRNIEVKSQIKTSAKKTSLIKIVLITVACLLSLFLAFVAYGAGVNNSFYKLILVTSDSMAPAFYSGDMIMIVKVEPDQVKVGDVVTFQTKDNKLLTHRVVEIKEDGEIVTKGDANEEADVWADGWKLEKATTKYIARIPVIGRFIVWINGLSVHDTGAWLKDTERLAMKLTADEWDVDTEQDMNETPEQLIQEQLVPVPDTTPTPTPNQKSTPAPEPTESPESTESPEPTESPGPTHSPQPTESPGPTDSPEPRESPEPTETPEPTQTEEDNQ